MKTSGEDGRKKEPKISTKKRDKRGKGNCLWSQLVRNMEESSDFIFPGAFQKGLVKISRRKKMFFVFSHNFPFVLGLSLLPPFTEGPILER